MKAAGGGSPRPPPQHRGAPPPVVALFDASITCFTLLAGFGGIYFVSSLAFTGFIDKEQLKFVMSVACPMVTMMQLISPIPVVLEAVRSLNVQNLPMQVFQSQAVVNISSICYGIKITNPAILITNMFGLLMQTLYMSADHYVRMNNIGWIPFAVKFSLMLNVVMFMLVIYTPINVVGNWITVVNIFLFAVPLMKLEGIIKTRNATALPTGLTCASCLNNASWSLYGFLIEDVVVLLPSVIGYFLCAFQVMVILWSNGILPFDLNYVLLRSRDGASLLRWGETKEEDIEMIKGAGKEQPDMVHTAKGLSGFDPVLRSPLHNTGKKLRPRLGSNA